MPGTDLISMQPKAINALLTTSNSRDMQRCLLEKCSRHWQEGINQHNSYRNHKPSAISVEISAYALCAYVCDGDIEGARSIARWLNGQRNSRGAFVSTQVSKEIARNYAASLILVCYRIQLWP